MVYVCENMELPLLCSCLLVSLAKTLVQNCTVCLLIPKETMELLRVCTKIQGVFYIFIFQFFVLKSQVQMHTSI